MPFFVMIVYLATFSNISSLRVNFCCLYFATTVFTDVLYFKTKVEKKRGEKWNWNKKESVHS